MIELDKTLKIAIGSDHAGYKLKEIIKEYLNENSYQVLDFGAFSEESVDYPDYAFPLAEAVTSEVADVGILICGTGIGMSITANKIKGIRAANCISTEMAKLSRQHNNANILTLGARLTDPEEAKLIVYEFLNNGFEGNRHIRRVEKIHSLTNC
ncbi:ribose 5-phosphate isomerase B [Candidatus Kapaibacterium sp.]